MRKVGCLLITATLALLLVRLKADTTIQAPPGAQVGAQRQTIDASMILAAAREALGGEKRLSAVKTFVATGRTRQIQGDNLVPIEFEISCELPDKFVRKDEIPAQDTNLTATGFRGDDLIQFPPSRTGRA